MKEETISNNNADAGNLANDAECDRHIHIKVGKGKKEASAHFKILGIYTKTHNKWYIDSASQKWNGSIAEGKYRVYARMIMLNHGFGKYRDVNMLDYSWVSELIYILCDAKHIDGVRGYLERDLFI